MSLTDRIKNTARNIAYTGITLATLVTTQPGCQPAYTPQTQPQNYSQNANKVEQYTLESFKRLPAMKGRLENFLKNVTGKNQEKS